VTIKLPRIRYRRAVIAASAAVTLAILLAPAAAATDKPDEPATSATEPVHDYVVAVVFDSIVVDSYDSKGRLLSTETLNSGLLFSQDNGTGGSSSASGCQKVTLRNRATTLLGSTAYRFNTWTYWCWSRQNRTISSVRTGWYLSDVDKQFVWREMIVDNTHYFSWYSGYPRSGYKHEKQARIENCVLHYGCIGNTYPRNVLYSYSNGTWSWYIYN
jgi:hypothetical protein